MNHSTCSSCPSLASSVCVHPSCSSPPFFCSHCLNPEAQLNPPFAHIHDDNLLSLPYQHFSSKIQQILNTSHTLHLNTLRKRIHLIIDDLNSLLLRYQQILTKIPLKLSQKTSSIITSFKSPHLNTQLTGADLHQLLSPSDRYQNHLITTKHLQIIKNQISQTLSQLQSIQTRKILNPVHALELYQQGRLLDDAKQFQPAMGKFKLAHRYNPIEPKYLKSIGYCYDEMGRMEEAVAAYEESIGLGAQGKVLGLCYNGLGFIYRNRKMYDRAVEYYTKAIGVMGDNSYYYYGRGFSERETGGLERAVEDFTKAIGMFPKRKYYEARAEVLRRLGREEEAREDERRGKAVGGK